MAGVGLQSPGQIRTPSQRQDGVSIRMNYPSPFFSLSESYIPSTMKELYRWGLYAFTVNPIIYQAVRKVAGYVTTDIIYSAVPGEKERQTEKWKNILERTLQVKRREKQYLLDYFVYGNAYAMILFPFERVLICPNCKKEHIIDNIEWAPQDLKFIAFCDPKSGGCGFKGEMRVEDQEVTSFDDLKLIRLNPRFIDPIFEPLTESYIYVYVIPKFLVNSLKSENEAVAKLYMSKVPLAIIDAVRKEENVKLGKNQIFHFKWDSLSRDDDALGEVPLMPVFKYLWLYHTHWRAQEAMAVENISPWLLLSPAVGTTVDPLKNFNLARWRGEMTKNVQQWRKDPNHVAIAPFPVNQVQLRGDYRNINNFEMIDNIGRLLALGQGVTPSFLYGGANYSGGSVELRVLENDFRNITFLLDEFLEWLTERLRHYYNLPDEKIKHVMFKMADDIQQKQMVFQAAAQGYISQESAISGLGMNAEEERKKRQVELELQNEDLKAQRMIEAGIQNDVNKEQMTFQIKAAVVQQMATMKLQEGEIPNIDELFDQIDQGEADIAAIQAAGGAMSGQQAQATDEGDPEVMQGLAELQIRPEQVPVMPSQELINLQAQTFMNTRNGPHFDNELLILEQSKDPVSRLVARQVKQLAAQMKSQQANISKMQSPNVAPPRRGPGTATE